MKLSNLAAAGLTATLLSTGFVAYAQTAPTEAEVVIMNEMVAEMPEVIALIEALKADGYTYIEIRRTLLGRAKIVAEGPDGTREVVMSTTTGEIMRDATHGADHGGDHETMGDGNHEEMGDGNHDGMDDGNHDNMGDGENGGMDGGSMGDGDTGGGMGGGNTGGGMGGGMGGN